MKRMIFKYLPKYLQKKIIRNAFDISKPHQNEIQYKLAETESELKQAFQLVHDNYVKQGFIQNQASKMRMIPHHQLETTGVIIAKKGEEVVGTLTLVRDGSLGLPMEVKFNFASIRKPGMRIAEVTCLAVKEEFRRANGGLIFPYLMKYMYEFAVQYFGVDQLVVAVYPKDAIFYEGLLCFSFLEKNPIEYYGAPAVGLYLDLNQAPSVFKKVFEKKTLAKNLFRFFVETNLECFSFPERLYSEIQYPHATQVSRKISKQLPPGEQIRVLRFDRDHQGQAPRIEVKQFAQLLTAQSTSFDIQLINVASGGLRILSHTDLDLEKTYKLELELSRGLTCSLEVIPRWKDEKSTYGIQITKYNSSWNQFIQTLESKQNEHQKNIEQKAS